MKKEVEFGGMIFYLRDKRVDIVCCDGDEILGRTFGTEEEAEVFFERRLEKEKKYMAKAEAEATIHRRKMESTFATLEDAKKAYPEETAWRQYECLECGNVFYALWRSIYTPKPLCPSCDCKDEIFVREMR